MVGELTPEWLFAAPTSVMQLAGFQHQVKVVELKNGNFLLQGLRIFKTGTFKDMFGEQSTWEGLHLDAMSQHYRMLKSNDVLPNVPVRIDHWSSAANIVGYFEDVYRDREDDSFLAADIEFTEPSAYEKWRRGTFRSRSLEMGRYESNEGTQFWPVILGLAFVDLPAIEGLYSKGPDGVNRASTFFFSSAIETRENTVGNGNEGQGQTGKGQTSTENQPAGQADQQPPPAPQQDQTQTPAGGQQEQPPATPPAGEQQQFGHSNTLSFRVNGQITQDFAAVQRHIDVLEKFQTDTTDTNRVDFVNQLASANKIGANQIEAFQNMVKTMTPQQFEQFQQAYEAAPPSSLLGQHGTQPEGENQTGQQQRSGFGPPQQTPQEQLATLEEVVERLKLSGMSKDKLEKTDAFQRLQAFKSGNQS